MRKRFEALAQDLEGKKIKDKTAIYQTIVNGTIDYLTFYAPYDLKIKRYKVELYPQFKASDSRDNDTFQLKHEPIHPFILKSKNILSVLQKQPMDKPPINMR